MTDFANLVIGVDSRPVKEGTAELDKLTAAGQRTETAITALARAQAQAKTNTAAWRAEMAAGRLTQVQFNDAVIRQKSALVGVEQEFRRATDEVRRLREQQMGLGASTKSVEFGMRNLGFQVNDVATQFALGTPPMRIFASQGGQVLQSVQLMTGSTSKLGAFLVGPWGVAITAATVVLVPLIGKLFETDEALKDVEFASGALGDAQDILGGVMDLTTGKINTQSTALLALAQAQAIAGEIGARTRQAEARGALEDEARLRTIITGSFGGGLSLSRERDVTGDIAEALLAGSLNTKEAVAGLNSLLRTGVLTEKQFLEAAQAVAAFGVEAENVEVFEQLQKALNGDAEATKQFLNETKKAKKEVKETKTEIQKLTESILGFDLAISKAGSRVDLATKLFEDGKISASALRREFDAFEKATDLFDDVPDDMIKVLDAGAVSAAKFGDVAEDAAKAVVKAFEREQDAARILNDQLRDMIGLLGQAGSVGGAIGGLLGILSGNTGAVRGTLGEILNAPTGKIIEDRKTGKLIGETVGDRLAGLFDRNSDFGKAMQGILANAGTGVLVGGVFGFDGKGGQLGGAIGGALAGGLSDNISKAVGGALGSALGALAPVIGGALGSALGSALAGTPKGIATIGGVNGALGITGTSGNRARVAAATDSAGAVIESLGALAAELGATLDPSRGSVSIGIRGDNFRVDPTGGGNTKKKKGAIDFGQDAEAAALFAIQDLIRDGVLVGLRKGTENLLKGAKDIEDGIRKALAFEGVFKELASITDPVGFALDELAREFERLRDIFEEAGATAEEFAQLEELLAIKRKEAIDEGTRQSVEKLADRNALEVELLQLLGREEEALAQARQFELLTLESSLRPLQEMIFTLQDARSVIEQFEPLADDLRAFREELLGGVGGTAGFSALSARFRDTATSAAGGDLTALANLRNVSSDFLAAARDNASSQIEFQRSLGEVLGAVDSGIFAADTQVDFARLQIEAIDANRAELLKMKDLLSAQNQTLVENSNAMRRLWERFEGDGLTVKADQDTPIFVKTAPGDTVATA